MLCEEADGFDRRRMRADGRRREGCEAPTRGRLPRAFQADQPRSAAPDRGRRTGRAPLSNATTASTPIPSSRRINGDWKKLAGGGSMFDIGIYGLNTALMMLGDDLPVSFRRLLYPRDDARFKEVEGGIDWRLRTQSGISVPARRALRARRRRRGSVRSWSRTILDRRGSAQHSLDPVARALSLCPDAQRAATVPAQGLARAAVLGALEGRRARPSQRRRKRRIARSRARSPRARSTSPTPRAHRAKGASRSSSCSTSTARSPASACSRATSRSRRLPKVPRARFNSSPRAAASSRSRRRSAWRSCSRRRHRQSPSQSRRARRRRRSPLSRRNPRPP